MQSSKQALSTSKEKRAKQKKMSFTFLSTIYQLPVLSLNMTSETPITQSHQIHQNRFVLAPQCSLLPLER
uniref:TATA-binding protein-associated factor TAFII55 n=1 Tax=Rhizophora mucronata TaxID=61149 RepID=A0A2P2JZE1_RHIMU